MKVSKSTAQMLHTITLDRTTYAIDGCFTNIAGGRVTVQLSEPAWRRPGPKVKAQRIGKNGQMSERAFTGNGSISAAMGDAVDWLRALDAGSSSFAPVGTTIVGPRYRSTDCMVIDTHTKQSNLVVCVCYTENDAIMVATALNGY